MWKSKFYGAFVLNHRVVLHAIGATPARWRGDAGSSPLDRAPDTLVDFHTGDCGDDEKACEIVALLSSRHANQAARNRSGERPVDTAHQRGNVALIKALNGAWEDFERLSLTT